MKVHVKYQECGHTLQEDIEDPKDLWDVMHMQCRKDVYLLVVDKERWDKEGSDDD